MKRTLVTATLLLVLLIPAAVAWAQDEGLTLESLAERLSAILATQNDHAQRLAALETATAPTPTPTPTPTIEPASLTTRREMNVRAGPGTNYAIIGLTAGGEKFLITGKNPAGDWLQIEMEENEIGWVYKQLVELTNAGDVKVIASIPTPTSTPVPAPASDVVAATLLQLDYEDVPLVWQSLPRQTQEELAFAYQQMLIWAADYCQLSYYDLGFLLDLHGDTLDAVNFTDENGIRPRGWLVAYIYGFGFDGTSLDAYNLKSCDELLALAVIEAKAQ